MANANSRFVDVTCEKCGCSGSIRIDQYNRRNGLWKCRSCNKKGQVPKNKGKGVINDPALAHTRRFVDVTCEKCGCSGSIRSDQYKRRNESWVCRSCTTKGRKNARKGKGVINDPALARTRSSFYKARYRCKTGHGGYYTNVECKFNSFWEIIDEIGPRPEGKTLDRIDNLGHYEPGNVRWATQKEQNNNKRKRGTVKK